MERMKNESKKWAAKEFGIPEEDVLDLNCGCCYWAIWVKTQASADKVSAKVKGGTVNGGMLDGMPLGGQSKEADGSFRVMC